MAQNARHETALSYLTDLEETLEVAQVQLEIYNTLAPRETEGGIVGERIRLLNKVLLSVTDVSLRLDSNWSSVNNPSWLQLYTEYAEPFDLPRVKLLVLHVSQHQDENLSRSIWNGIFEEGESNIASI
jgi:nuclear pore complex protein Nup155